MRVLVTGASGFLGRAVVECAVAAGHDVVALVRPAARLDDPMWEQPAVEVVRGDLRQDGRWIEAVRGVDAVVHAAAAAEGDLATQFEGTVVGTERLLDALGPELPRFVHVSSLSVYDFAALAVGDTLDESSALEPDPKRRDAYTTTKLAQERLVRQFADRTGMPLVVVRPGAIYGPGKDWAWATSMRVTARVSLLFSPRAEFRVTYLDNCADAIVAAISAPAAVGATVNVIDDDPPTHLEFWRACRRVGGDVPRVVPVPWILVAAVGRLSAVIDRLWWGGRAKVPEMLSRTRQQARWKPLHYANDVARRTLSWRPRITLAEGVGRTMGAPSPDQRRCRILNAEIDDITMAELLEKRTGTILTLHVDMMAKLQRDRDFYEILPKFDVVTCDSQVLFLATRFLSRPLRERVSGSDYFPLFYERYRDDPSMTVFLCGAQGDISTRAMAKVNEHVGRDMVVGAYGPPLGFERDPEEIEKILRMVDESNATVLVVGFSAPKGERFIVEYRDRLPKVRLFLPLGGTIDYEAGDVLRPPRWITKAGLEWLFRLVREPKRRWRRYVLHQPPVLYHLLMDRIGRYRDPFRAADQDVAVTSTE